jgi:predicted sulfurtransferase
MTLRLEKNARTSRDLLMSATQWTTVLFYKYTEVGDVDALAEEIQTACQQCGMKGRALVADEGINANLGCEAADDMQRFVKTIKEHPVLGDHNGEAIDFKYDTVEGQPFPDTAVKKVKELVSTAGTMPVQLLTREGLGGNHLSPEDFHAAIAASQKGTDQKEVVLLDVRNRKEFNIGHFEGAVDTNTKMFSEWGTHFAAKKAPELKDKKVLMYCTGGIRCEKASAYLRSLGVQDVSQLSGGIHRYLERYGSGGYFKGSNFVFDSRGVQRPEAKGCEKGSEGASEDGTAAAVVLGKCSECTAPTEELSSDRVCAVCRDGVLVCDGCRSDARFSGVYYCSEHRGLQGSYFPFVHMFGVLELQRQRKALRWVRLRAKMSTPSHAVDRVPL